MIEGQRREQRNIILPKYFEIYFFPTLSNTVLKLYNRLCSAWKTRIKSLYVQSLQYGRKYLVQRITLHIQISSEYGRKCQIPNSYNIYGENVSQKK